MKFILTTTVVFLSCFSLATDYQSVIAGQDIESNKTDDQSADPAQIEERLQEALGSLRAGKYDEGVAVIRELQQSRPDNVELKLTMIQLLQQVGSRVSSDDRSAANKYYFEAAEMARKLREQASLLPPAAEQLLAGTLYNEACSLATEGRTDQALVSLKEAFEAGFDEFVTASHDKDFGDLRDSDEFKNLVAEQKKLAGVRLHEHTRKEFDAFRPFDFDFEITDLDGKSVKKTDFAGKLLIVDFWGTWCPPCRAEIPSFIKLKNEYPGKVDVVGFAFEQTKDDKESADNVAKFMKDVGINYSCALGSEKLAKQLPELNAFPTTLFLDEKGQVRMVMVGFRTYEQLEAAIKVLSEDDSGTR